MERSSRNKRTGATTFVSRSLVRALAELREMRCFDVLGSTPEARKPPGTWVSLSTRLSLLARLTQSYEEIAYPAA